jgi:murein DD-endopeptidase MepM/ murein hydrolase activator NlpD
VVAGDTLYDIARRHGTSVQQLQQLNNLTDTTLRIGQVLTVSTAPPRPAEVAPGFATHIVVAGETLAELLARYRISRELLLAINADVAVEGSFPPGVALRIPKGPVHRVDEGENLLTIALRYGLSPTELAAANGVSSASAVSPGQWLVIPTPLVAESRDLHAYVEAPRDRRSVLLAAQRRLAGRAAEVLGRFEPPAEGYRWPLATRGVISSLFGPRALSGLGSTFHTGLDIAAPTGTPILAARDGVVTRAGWGGVYGYVVFVDHADGSQTRYAHMSRILVEVGRYVAAGETLGLVGSTGASTGPHLHFEIRLHGRAVNPLDYLTRPD